MSSGRPWNAACTVNTREGRGGEHGGGGGEWRGGGGGMENGTTVSSAGAHQSLWPV